MVQPFKYLQDEREADESKKLAVSQAHERFGFI